MLTAFYHAKATLKKNDVLRDSFLVMAYITVVFATWTTRSGVLSSVHGFGLSLVSWTMLMTLLFNLIAGVSLAFYAGFRDMEDDEDSSLFGFFDYTNVRLFSIKMSLIGLIIVASTSTIGVALPATYNLGIAIFNPTNLEDGMVGIDVEFFRIGFYTSAIFLIASAFYCMRSKFLSYRRRGIFIVILFGVGAALAVLSEFSGLGPLPTNYWPANLLIPPAIGAILFLLVTFVRHMAGREGKMLNMRQMGRLMLHLGLIILLLGVFFSENVVYETNSGYTEGNIREVAPGIEIRVADIDLHWVNDEDFNMVVTVQIIENDQLVGMGFATVTGHPEWRMISHVVYVDSSALRDVFIAVIGFTTITMVPEPVYQVTLHTKILPFISLVWVGPFLMIAAMVPMLAIEGGSLLNSLKKKDEHLYLPDSEESKESTAEISGN
jgi:cytochrome c-type biogenesis protein CcmF